MATETAAAYQTISPSNSILTLGEPVLSLTLYYWKFDRETTRMSPPPPQLPHHFKKEIHLCQTDLVGDSTKLQVTAAEKLLSSKSVTKKMCEKMSAEVLSHTSVIFYKVKGHSN